jgi:hypothetical protein
MRLYPQFERQCVRNLLAGTALSILPAGAFYFFVFPFTARQLGILATLGILNLAAFMPLDIWLLKWTLRPVKAALAEGARMLRAAAWCGCWTLLGWCCCGCLGRTR